MVDWYKACASIESRIKVNDDINSQWSTLRSILGKNDNGFVVKVGATSSIIISYDMLKECFNILLTPQGFSREQFRRIYPRQNVNKPCYFHCIGQIFCRAGLANIGKSGRRYELIQK